MLTNIIIVLAPLIGVLLIVYLPCVLIAVLLMVPVLKYPLLYYFPVTKTVDFTVLVCALVGIAAICRWLRKRRGNRGFALSVPWAQLACMSFISLLLFIGIVGTTAPEYGLRKAVRFTGIGIPFLLVPTFFVYSKKDAHRMILVIALIGLLVAPIILALPTSEPSEMRHGGIHGRATLLGSDANAVGAVIGLSFVAFLTSFVIQKRPFRQLMLLMFPTLLLYLVAILFTGSRATLLGLMITGIFLLLMAGKGMLLRWRVASAGFICILFLAMLFSMLRPESRFLQEDRWRTLGSDVRTGAIVENTRTEAWKFCISKWWDAPVIGHGLGSFAMDFGGTNDPMWPHNIILEALYELGLIGCIAVIMFIVVTAGIGFSGLRETANVEDRLLVIAPFAMMIFMTTFALTHWDLSGNRYMYFFSGLLYVNVRVSKRPGKTQSLPKRNGCACMPGVRRQIRAYQLS